MSENSVHHAFAEAVPEDFVVPVGHSYRLLHDRVQEAAYALIPEPERPALHLRIGRILWSRLSARELTEHLFEVVNQLNRGRGLLQ